MIELLLILIPIAAFLGWYVTSRREATTEFVTPKLPRDYLVGLNFLLNEQPDKAVDVFIKMLEVDSDTVETHLALGSLFRRRGEVDRAIRIHQNLIARPHLEPQQRIAALLALGQDYMRAGVLDRAERIFQEIVDSGQSIKASLIYLIDIYQQEKAWQNAIVTAKKLQFYHKQSMIKNIAHYHCELAERNIQNNQMDVAKKRLKQALSYDCNCARANLISGDIARQNGKYKIAIRHYQQVAIQDPDYITETLLPIADCYRQLNKEYELII